LGNRKRMMEKVIIIGPSGSGKTTFSVALHNATGLPLYHLDNIWWNADKTHISRPEFDLKLSELLCRDSWIIDGDYSRTYEPRIAACDTIFFLDFDINICMEGLTQRLGKSRPDMPWIDYELDQELVARVQKYETENKPVLLSLFEKYPEKRVIIFKTRQEAEEWIRK
ncbi:MAG: hypothetical protein IKP73_09205, partial [Bacteroidales bacterium]|nr:hypothetical protein [Bacteroidales bacterium]